jgi:hypothetical protein
VTRLRHPPGALDSRFRGNDDFLAKENRQMEEPITLEIFTDYV